MRWHQPESRTVEPISAARSAPQVWVRYRCIKPSMARGCAVSAPLAGSGGQGLADAARDGNTLDSPGPICTSPRHGGSERKA
jgi:hypothetical protein